MASIIQGEQYAVEFVYLAYGKYILWTFNYTNKLFFSGVGGTVGTKLAVTYIATLFATYNFLLDFPQSVLKIPYLLIRQRKY